MMQFTPQMSLFLAIHPTDFRRGIDGLVATCQQQLNANPFSGTVFAFTNRRRNAIKLLTYDGNGFWLCLKRFSKGKLKWWPKENCSKTIYHIGATELNILLHQGNPIASDLGSPWKKLPSQPTTINKED